MLVLPLCLPQEYTGNLGEFLKGLYMDSSAIADLAKVSKKEEGQIKLRSATLDLLGIKETEMALGVIPASAINNIREQLCVSPPLQVFVMLNTLTPANTFNLQEYVWYR